VSSTKSSAQAWHGIVGVHRHRVDVAGSVRREIVWTVDGSTLATKCTLLPRAQLRNGDHGRVLVGRSMLTASHRVTAFPPGTGLKRVAGLGGTNLSPEPGSKAARQEQKILDNPARYVASQGLGGVVAVVVPILLIALLVRLAAMIAWPHIELPDLPSAPLPDLDLPDIRLPSWLQNLLDTSDYVTPVIIAIVIAWFDIRRRKRNADGQQEGGSAKPRADA
jgi:hypothetical protein